MIVHFTLYQQMEIECREDSSCHAGDFDIDMYLFVCEFQLALNPIISVIARWVSFKFAVFISLISHLHYW